MALLAQTSKAISLNLSPPLSPSLSGRIARLEEEVKEVRSSLSDAESTKRELQQSITDLEKVKIL